MSICAYNLTFYTGDFNHVNRTDGGALSLLVNSHKYYPNLTAGAGVVVQSDRWETILLPQQGTT
ncbi:hypothetical protein D0T87_24210 [Bacteroides sp. 51]|nr:hypothetical protein [Bacteroides sp. 51]